MAPQLPVSNLCQHLEDSSRRFPDRIAVLDADGRSLTYRQLNDCSDRIAGFLLERGIQPGDRVGLAQPKSLAALSVIFGTLKAQAAYIPVDNSAPPARIRTILEDCQVKALFADRRCASLAPWASTVVLAEQDPDEAEPSGDLPEGIVTWQQALEHDPHVSHPESHQADALAFILYTSGSTGAPKGVIRTHRNILSFLEWCSSAFKPDENDCFANQPPLHFSQSVLSTYLSIKHGGTLFLITEELSKNPRALAALIASHRLTVWYSTPSILSLLADYGNLDRFDCSHLRLILFSGEAFPLKHLRKLTRIWPRPAYFQLYASTEANVSICGKIPLPIPEDRTEPYPMGWPGSHCSALVFDENGSPVAPGKEGFLHITGPAVFGGYWGREEESTAVFREWDGRRWFNTGDMVKWDPNAGFSYVGRSNRMVKRRGYRIELGEIESVLYRHEGIQQAAVVAAADVESRVRIVAYVVRRDPAEPSIVDLKLFCSNVLPVYFIPDVFIFRDSLPRTSTNKVDYQALSRDAAASVTHGPS